MAALAVNYRRLEDINERRRVRVLVAGTGVALLAAIAYIAIQSSRSASVATGWAEETSLTITLEAVLFLVCLTFPLSFAYAILRHRLFDIRVMVRQGLQYAVARGALLSLVPALAAILALDLLLHRDQPLAVIMQARGWVYVGLGALVLTAHVMR